MNDEILRNWKNVTSLVAFPNLIESGALPWTLTILMPVTYSSPFTRLYDWLTSFFGSSENGKER